MAQKIIPAILTSDPAELRESLKSFKEHAKWVHIDIMDGKFVPNTSINLFELGEAYQFFHLMVENPEKYLEDCKGVEAKRVIFHAEATHDVAAVLMKMDGYGFQKSVAINPETDTFSIAPYIEKMHGVLVMSVHPGLQGQEFIPDVLSKIPEIRKMKDDSIIGVDGGVNEGTLREVFAAGADYACAGSAVVKSADPAAALRRLEELATARKM